MTFYWSVYNINGSSLFTLDFYNGDLGIYYALNNTNTPHLQRRGLHQ